MFRLSMRSNSNLPSEFPAAGSLGEGEFWVGDEPEIAENGEEREERRQVGQFVAGDRLRAGFLHGFVAGRNVNCAMKRRIRVCATP